MAPEACKKIAEKKPTEENKPIMVEKASTEKKPKVEKKLPKEDGADSDTKKKGVEKSMETYKIHIFNVLKQVHPDIEIKAKEIVNIFINGIFEKLASSLIATISPTITYK